MNFEELEASLPNGLHDAKLRHLGVDYTSRTACIELAIWVGDSRGRTRDAREAYRGARITLHNLAFVSVDAPENGDGDGELRIDAGPGVAPTASPKLPSALPKECFVHWIFVSKWNAFIHVAAETASICWIDE